MPFPPDLCNPIQHIYIYKDSSASFSSSLCSRFVKNDNKQLGKIYEKRKTGLVTPPSLVHYSKKGTYPGNPVPPNQAGQTPDPGQVLGSLKGDPFSLISSSSKVALGISSLSFPVKLQWGGSGGRAKHYGTIQGDDSSLSPGAGHQRLVSILF